MKNIAPKSANISRTTSTVPADNATERNNRRGSSGWRARRSRKMNSQEWREKGSSDPGVMAAAFDAYADQMTAALAGHWS